MAASSCPTTPAERREATRWAPLSSGRIPSLDGLRAISILAVIGFHWVNAIVRARTGADYDGPWRMLLNGELGVSIFFVVSGFLITHLLLREQDKTGAIDLKAFYIRRSFRIWPAFYFYLFVVAILQIRGVFWVGIGNLIAAATFTFNYAPHAGGWWTGHSWTLSVEEQFYLAWPLAVMLLRRRNVGRLAIALIILVPLVRLAEVLRAPVVHLSAQKLDQRLNQLLHTRADTLMFGCTVALFYANSGFQRLVAFCEHWGITAVGVVYLLTQPAIERACPKPLDAVFAFTLQGAAIALVLVWVIRNADRPIGRVLNSRPVVHVGRISFSLYLWQQMFFVYLNTSWTGRFPANVLLAFGVAELSFHFIEKPFLSFRDRFLHPHRPTAVRGLPVVAVVEVPADGAAHGRLADPQWKGSDNFDGPQGKTDRPKTPSSI